MRGEMRKYRRLIGLVSLLAMVTAGLACTLYSQAVEKKASKDPTYIYFGNYWQQDTNGDGKADQSDQKTPIKWRVLQQSGETALLFADQCLDAQPYHTAAEKITWENCSLRQWLNQEFLEEAFTAGEQGAIQQTTITTEGDIFLEQQEDYTTQDKVFVPSIAELSNASFGFSVDEASADAARATGNTAYAAGLEGRLSVGQNDNYWLRNQGQSNEQAATITVYGFVMYQAGVHITGVGVRPMLYLDMGQTDVWSDREGGASQPAASASPDSGSAGDILMGDVYTDGKVNGKDVSMLARYCLQKETFTAAQFAAGDVYGDGKINGKDVSKLARYCLGKETIASQ